MTSSNSKSKIFNITKMSHENFRKSSLMNSFISESNGEIDLNGMINAYIASSKNDTINSFHTNFTLFKQALSFKRTYRKTKIDSILKKCKSKFFRAVQEAIKALLEDENSMPHFLQEYITNINIETNKKDLNISLKNLYIKYDNDFQYDQMLKKVPLENQGIMSTLMSQTYEELFKGYINSRRFVEDCDVIREKEGEKFEILYRYIAKIYISYYNISKGNKTKLHCKIDTEKDSKDSMKESESNEIRSNKKFCVIKNKKKGLE